VQQLPQQSLEASSSPSRRSASRAVVCISEISSIAAAALRHHRALVLLRPGPPTRSPANNNVALIRERVFRFAGSAGFPSAASNARAVPPRRPSPAHPSQSQMRAHITARIVNLRAFPGLKLPRRKISKPSPLSCLVISAMPAPRSNVTLATQLHCCPGVEPCSGCCPLRLASLILLVE